MKFEQKHFGLVMSAFSLVVLAIFFSSAWQLAEISHAQCALVNAGCTVFMHIPLTSYIGFAVLIALAASGIYIFLRLKSEEKIIVKTTAALAQAIKKLSGDSKTVFDAVAAEGTIFQSDLIRKTGFSKVKVSRILDRLEMGGLVERRRRGMANVIVLKARV